jgi:acetolactate synthase-1/2/3 large subunit
MIDNLDRDATIVYASQELREFVDHRGILVASTLMGLGYFSSSHEKILGILGMHGVVYANYAVDKADMLLAFGVLFHDRVIGKLESFASCASIIHIDIDITEIRKKKQPHISLCTDVQLALQGLNYLMKKREDRPYFSMLPCNDRYV